MNNLYIITGPAGVGKSTVSKKIAEQLDKSVLIEGDDIYNQFVGGRIAPYKDNAPLDLFWDNSLMLIENYLKNGYDVVFNYIIMKDRFTKLKEKFKQYQVKFVVLLTNEETIVKRDLERPIDCRMGERSIILLNAFKNEKYNKNYLLDTTYISIDNSVMDIIKNNKYLVNNFKISKTFEIVKNKEG